MSCVNTIKCMCARKYLWRSASCTHPLSVCSGHVWACSLVCVHMLIWGWGVRARMWGHSGLLLAVQLEITQIKTGIISFRGYHTFNACSTSELNMCTDTSFSATFSSVLIYLCICIFALMDFGACNFMFHGWCLSVSYQLACFSYLLDCFHYPTPLTGCGDWLNHFCPHRWLVYALLVPTRFSFNHCNWL